MKHSSLLAKTILSTWIFLLASAVSWGQDVIPIVAGQTYLEDFESGTLDRWTVESTGNATWAVMNGTSSSVAAFQNGATGDEARLVSPVFDMSAVGGATLSFGYAMMALFDNDVLSVSYRSSEADPWHELNSYSINDWANTYDDSFELPDISSTYQISFLGQCFGGYYIFIDNIEISSAEGCARPANLQATYVTASSAQLEWSTTGNESQWIIELNGHEMTVESQPYVMENLDPQTEYTFRVQAVCGEDMTSDWSFPKTFKTLCEVITVTNDEPYFDDFGASEDFLCWQNEIESGDGGWVIDPGYLILNNTAFFIWLNEVAWLTSAPLDLTAVTLPTLTFKYKQPQGTSGNVDELSVWYATSSNDYWHLLAEYNTVADDWQEATFALPEASDHYLIGFKGKSNDANGVYVDDVWVGNQSNVGVDEPHLMAAASPNPTTNTILISTNIAEGEVMVYDLFGRLVAEVELHDGRAIVDLSSCAQGVYMAKISGGNGMATLKLVKE